MPVTIGLPKKNLTIAESGEVARRLQVAVLEELVRAGAWTVRDTVFQGGTSLRLAWGSPRFSLDLDFLVTPATRAGLDGVLKRTLNAVKRRLALEISGSFFELKATREQERVAGARQRLARYEVRWSHPARHGKVATKIEFYEIEPTLLAAYRSTVRAGIRVADVEAVIRTPIPVADPASIFADKMIALAMRSHFKPRDVFDVWFLRSQLNVDLSDAALLEGVRNCAAMYDYAPAVLASNLRARAASAEMRDQAAFVEDMRRWIPPNTFQSLEAAGCFAGMLGGAVDAMERVTRLLVASMKMEPWLGPGLEEVRAPAVAQPDFMAPAS